MFGSQNKHKKTDDTTTTTVTESNNEHLPRWLEPENDDAIREEVVAPLLFGTGVLSLKDSPQQKEDDRTTTSSSSQQKKKSSTTTVYGSILGTENDDEEESKQPPQIDDDEEKRPFQKNKKKMLLPIDPAVLKPHRPHMNPCLWMFHLLEGISVTASVCLLLTQIIPFFQTTSIDNKTTSATTSTMSLLDILLKIYISMFCLLFILTEIQAPIPSIRNSPILQVYISRGFLYSFVGLICVEEAYSERVKEVLNTHHDEFYVGWYAIFMDVSSGFMLACGITYMTLGLCCLKRLRDRIKQQEIDAWKQYRIDMKAWNEKYGP
jgi:hypothetical protein